MIEKIKNNIDFINETFHTKINKDIITREFLTAGGIKCFIVFVDGMCSSQMINQFIVKPLMENSDNNIDPFNVIEYHNCSTSTNIDDAVNKILSGDTAIFVDNCDYYITCETKGFDRRSVSNPLTESVIKGPHQGFTESIRSNLTLIRRIVKSPDLITEMITIGEINNQTCAVMYIDKLTNKKFVSRIKKRLNNIKADYISDSGMVTQLIEDNKNSIFPSILSTERPDRVAQYLLAGRLAVICDNSPYVLILPIDIGVLFDSPEGNSQRWLSGSFERFLRAFSVILTTCLSAVYLSILNFHQDFMPSNFINQILESRASIPFSPFIELLVMEIMFDLVREAGLRVPSTAGSAIGVVGGLILGQAAIDANLVSPTTLIVVAISGLANSVIPDYDISFTIRIIRFSFIVVAQFFGISGVLCAIIFILIALSNTKSLGNNLLSEDFNNNYGNVIYQKPLWKQEMRLKILQSDRKVQQPKYSRKWDER